MLKNGLDIRAVIRGSFQRLVLRGIEQYSLSSDNLLRTKALPRLLPQKADLSLGCLKLLLITTNLDLHSQTD